jgi:hypothetical protein
MMPALEIKPGPHLQTKQHLEGRFSIFLESFLSVSLLVGVLLTEFLRMSPGKEQHILFVKGSSALGEFFLHASPFFFSRAHTGIPMHTPIHLSTTSFFGSFFDNKHAF